MTTPDEPTPLGEFLLYTTEDGRTRVECRFEDETLWLSQKLMAELFDVEVPTVNEHLKTLFESGEIDPAATIRKFRIVRQEGKRQVARVKKQEADAHAANQYEAFEERRRQLLEGQAERDAFQQLEDLEEGNAEDPNG